MPRGRNDYLESVDGCGHQHVEEKEQSLNDGSQGGDVHHVSDCLAADCDHVIKTVVERSLRQQSQHGNEDRSGQSSGADHVQGIEETLQTPSRALCIHFGDARIGADETQ